MDVQLRTGVPCAFGVLTVENMDQALARTGGGKRDQGAHAAEAVVTLARHEALAAPKRLRRPSWLFPREGGFPPRCSGSSKRNRHRPGSRSTGIASAWAYRLATSAAA